MAEWPDWHPPAEMIERQPYLPRFMAGGEGNPLGARALYLGKTLYRIHGTNQPSTIGKYVSSGCIRLTQRGHRRISTAACRSAPASWCCRARRPRRPRTRRRRSSSRCSSGKLPGRSARNARPRAGHFHFCAMPRAIASTITVTCSRSSGERNALKLLLEPDAARCRARPRTASARAARGARACVAGASLRSGSSI